MTKRKNQYVNENSILKIYIFLQIPAYKSIIGIFYAL